MFRGGTFPYWITARMFQDDTAGKDCLVIGRMWGLEETDAYQAALERLLRNAEGDMNCRYDDNNSCRITGKASRVGQTVHINFSYSGDKCGPENEHEPRDSVIGWDTDDGSETKTVTNVQISK